MNCINCKHWVVNKEHEECLKDGECMGYNVSHPHDEDFRPIDIGFKLGQCKNRKISFYETPQTNDGATVCDGSHYHAEFITAEKFGCVLWEPEPKERE